MGRIQAGLGVTALACLLTTGCVKERFMPAASLPANWNSDNACTNLDGVRSIRPRYPQAAVKDGQQGWVALKYHVAANGDVFNVRVVASSPRGVFDDASAAALTHRRYEATTYPVRNCKHLYVYTLKSNALAPSQDDAGFAAFEEIRPR